MTTALQTSAPSRTDAPEPVPHKPVGWCRIKGSAALYAGQAHSTEVLFEAASKTPARRDGLVLDRRLRLDPGLVSKLNG
ncbi:hypothetical protein [uncultured Tateyamaria sp.]|uniref:hypothetical protein n=1 Tax=uncultured Tateyamaria sp. TaxID=455651 RepID=UPI002620C1A5|nr:hypothetical protein [uncultured Tateyamaria sp.]